MAEKDKKYYWLKLKNDFFKRHDIRIIEGMPNGKDYILFYLKLLVESVGHEGSLRFSDTIPYNDEMLSTITNTNIDVVRSAIKIFRELQMMDILDDGTIYMDEVNKMIGSETRWAEKKREYRADQQNLIGHSEDNVLAMSDKSKSTELEKELEVELEEESEKEAGTTTPNQEAILKEIFTSYEQEIGSITPILAQDIVEYVDKLGKELIVYAINDASRKNIRNWSYINAILERLVRQNIKSLADLKSMEPRKGGKKETKESKYKDIFMN